MKIVCISDTHCQLSQVKVPEGDILIHCGDWTYTGEQKEMQAFGRHLKKLKHHIKILIPGNHDLTMDPQHPKYHKNAIKWIKPDETITIATNKLIQLNGLNILCSSMINPVGHWAFGRTEQEKLEFYSQFYGLKIDIVVSHSPPRYILDEMMHYGCKELRSFINVIKPKYHIFGHCHGNYGQITDNGTTFINASTCNLNYIPNNKPVILEI